MSDTGRRSSRRPGPDPSVTIEALHQQLRDAIDAIESGEQWRAWLEFAQKLHKYSFNNLILIWSQRPSASQVAGYTTWQSVGRQVRRGEKAIRVMAPVIRKAKDLDPNAQARTDPTGQIRTKQIVGFRSVSVFDIGQTDGPPVPHQDDPRLLAGTAPDGLWDALAHEVAERGYRLMRCPANKLDGANGRTDVTEREVWVRDDVDPAQAVKTLAHELAHVMLHVDDGTIPQCRGIIEVEAESVAHLVLGSYQLNTGTYSFPYVAAWAYPLAAVEHVPLSDIVARTGARVMGVANEIITSTQKSTETASGDGLAPLAARVLAAARQTTELRDQAEAAALPPVNRDTLIGVVNDSHDFYRRQVGSSWVPAYLAKRRLGEAIESHQIGYAPGGWTTLADHLRRLGYTDDHIEAAGMAARARSGQLIDRMRDRMIVPLRDRSGGCVGFSGRRAPGEAGNGPKYLNTPATAIFKKSELLFGLAENRSKADYDHPVICEGPLDAIAVDLVALKHRLDIFGVAASGTAFTRDHALLLQHATRGQPICLAFDGDEAGGRATEAAWRLITNSGWRVVTIAELPTGADPADLFAAEPPALAQAITASRPAGTVIAERQIASADLAGNVNQEVAAFRDLVRNTGRMPRDERVPYVLMLADKLRIDPPLAAALVAEVNPHMMMERTIQHCHDLGKQLHAAQARQQKMITDPALLPDREQLAITTRNLGEGT